MASMYGKNYDPQKDSATSGVEVTDLNPQNQRDVDLRRLDPEERNIYSDRKGEFSHSQHQQSSQKKISQFMKAVKSANKYRQSALVAEPSIRGKTPVGKSYTSSSPFGGTELPSLRGRNYGDPGAGGTEYAHKPTGSFGTFYGFS